MPLLRPQLPASVYLAALLLVALAPSTHAHADDYVFITKWGSNGSGDGQFSSPRGAAVDAAGNVYVADGMNRRIQKFTSTGTLLTKWGSTGTGDGQFVTPRDVAVDASGNVYVADTDNHRIQKFTSTGTFTTKWGSSGSGDGQFSFPNGVAVDGSGNVYVADKHNSRVQKFSSTGTFLTKWGSYGSGDGQFDAPSGVAVDGSGNVYVADSDGHRIQKFTSTGAFITKWGSYGSGDGQFGHPWGVAVDPAGNVYVVDPGNNRTQKFTSTGTFLTKWGSNGSGDGQFSSPWGVAVDAAGNVYVVDQGNHRLQKFGPRPTLAWTGGKGYAGDGCHPNSGGVRDGFTFKVRFTDTSGRDPLDARCIIRKLDRDGWRTASSLPMARLSGTLSTGAIYRMCTPLYNYTYKYRFKFVTAGGDVVALDEPCAFRQGPQIVGPPKLCWTGKTRYTVDGVHPNSGPTGTKFTFKVLYRDSDGQAPDTRELVIRRNGSPYKTKNMILGGGAGYRLGRIYAASWTATQSGSYTYRFRFISGGLAAKDDEKAGDPTRNTSGPNITESGALVVSGLSSLPTNMGAQLTFTLSSSADVTATVLNLAGRPVRTICSGRECDAGSNTLLWNAMSDLGVRAPNGVYLVEVAVKAEDGGQTRALTQVRIGR